MAKRDIEAMSPENRKGARVQEDDDEDDEDMDVKEMFKSIKGMMKTMKVDLQTEMKRVTGKVNEAVMISQEATQLLYL